MMPLETVLENRIKLLIAKKDRWLLNSLFNGYKHFGIKVHIEEGIKVNLQEEEVKLGMPFETVLYLEGPDGKKIGTKLKQVI